VTDRVTDALLYALAENCAHLSYLEVQCVTKHVTDAAVIALALGCPHLDSLVLQTCPSLTDRSILAIAHHCPAFQCLEIPGSPHITEAALTQLLRSCPSMNRLDVSTASITQEAAQRLQREGGRARITRVQASVLVWMAAKAASARNVVKGWWRAAVGLRDAAVHPS
jgi:hypothetical protein